MARYKVMNAGMIGSRNQRLNDIVELNDAEAAPLLANGNVVLAGDTMPAKKPPANPTAEEERVRDNSKRQADLERGQKVTPEPKPSAEEMAKRSQNQTHPERPFNPPSPPKPPVEDPRHPPETPAVAGRDKHPPEAPVKRK